jgi:hypothetical protein
LEPGHEHVTRAVGATCGARVGRGKHVDGTVLLITALPLCHRLAGRIVAPAIDVWLGDWIMTKRKRVRAPKRAPAEKHCPACGGSGVTKVKQPAAPGHRVFTPRCGECGGKGRITTDDA